MKTNRLSRKVIKPVSNFFSSPVAGGIVLDYCFGSRYQWPIRLREGYETLLKYKQQACPLSTG
jgi:NhaA family Na+:H+ antiporter